MNIGIDAHMLGHNETGNETYVLELVRALTARENGNRYFIYVEMPDALPEEVRIAPGVYVRRYSTRSSMQRLIQELPSRAEHDKLDVLHISYNAPLRLPPHCALVVTIHDISYEEHPAWFPRRLRAFLRVSVPRSARAAQHILTDTECAKADLVRIYHLPAEKIQVTPYAADARFHPMENQGALDHVRAKFNTSEQFVLAVGNVQPRKNLVRLMRAFAQAKQQYQLPHRLVLVGGTLWNALPILQEATALGDAVLMTGYVPAPELPLLYNAADLFCYPSLYEGFGLPVLEAMACGTPVITSNVSSLPEVAGDAARLVNPCDTDALAQAIGEVLTQPDAKPMWRAKGLARARLFSWERTAQQTLEGYRQAHQQLSKKRLGISAWTMGTRD
jgi:glycosyltransferase involved in cell wall biosynthesis